MGLAIAAGVTAQGLVVIACDNSMQAQLQVLLIIWITSLINNLDCTVHNMAMEVFTHYCSMNVYSALSRHQLVFIATGQSNDCSVAGPYKMLYSYPAL